MVKCLALGYKCHDWDLDTHSAEQKHQSLKLIGALNGSAMTLPQSQVSILFAFSLNPLETVHFCITNNLSPDTGNLFFFFCTAIFR